MPSDKDKIELHEELLVLLKRFDEICEKNDIKYSLHGGTLLGAIRDKGFIPWDDDADITMTHENYKKLCDVMNSHVGDKELFFEECGDSAPKVWLKRENHILVWVDILVYEYISEFYLARKLKYLVMVFFLGFTKTKDGMKVTKIGEYKGIRYMIIYILYSLGRLFPHKLKVSWKYAFAAKYLTGSKKFMVRFNDQYKALNLLIPETAVNSYIKVPFEDTELMVHAGYEEILISTYGKDYMIPVKQEEFHKGTHRMMRNLKDSDLKK